MINNNNNHNNTKNGLFGIISGIINGIINKIKNFIDYFIFLFQKSRIIQHANIIIKKTKKLFYKFTGLFWWQIIDAFFFASFGLIVFKLVFRIFAAGNPSWYINLAIYFLAFLVQLKLNPIYFIRSLNIIIWKKLLGYHFWYIDFYKNVRTDFDDPFYPIENDTKTEKEKDLKFEENNPGRIINTNIFNKFFQEVFYFLIFIQLLIMQESIIYTFLNFLLFYFLIFNKFYLFSSLISLFLIISKFVLLTTDDNMYRLKHYLNLLEHLEPYETIKPTKMNIKIISFLIIRNFNFGEGAETYTTIKNIKSNAKYKRDYFDTIFSSRATNVTYLYYKYKQLHGALNFPPYQYQRMEYRSRYARYQDWLFELYCNQQNIEVEYGEFSTRIIKALIEFDKNNNCYYEKYFQLMEKTNKNEILMKIKKKIENVICKIKTITKNINKDNDNDNDDNNNKNKNNNNKNQIVEAFKWPIFIKAIEENIKNLNKREINEQKTVFDIIDPLPKYIRKKDKKKKYLEEIVENKFYNSEQAAGHPQVVELDDTHTTISVSTISTLRQPESPFLAKASLEPDDPGKGIVSIWNSTKLQDKEYLALKKKILQLISDDEIEHLQLPRDAIIHKIDYPITHLKKNTPTWFLWKELDVKSNICITNYHSNVNALFCSFTTQNQKETAFLEGIKFHNIMQNFSNFSNEQKDLHNFRQNLLLDAYYEYLENPYAFPSSYLPDNYYKKSLNCVATINNNIEESFLKNEHKPCLNIIAESISYSLDLPCSQKTNLGLRNIANYNKLPKSERGCLNNITPNPQPLSKCKRIKENFFDD